MNRARLLACPSCARHVRADEPSCPFCASAMPDERRQAPAPRGPTRRMTRNALYVFGLASVTATAACSGTVVDAGGDSGAEAAAPDDAHAHTGDVTIDGPDDAQPDGIFAVDAGYGCPPDACDFHEVEAGDAADEVVVESDAMVFDGFAPPYGTPPSPGPDE